MSKVRIAAHPETKALFTAAKEGWVKCQIFSEEMTVSNGLITLNKRVAFPTINARIAELPAFKNLKDGDEFPIAGKIIRKTTLAPQYEGHKAAVNPSTGEELGYYITFEFTTNLNQPDVDERGSITNVPSIAQALGGM